MILLSLLNVTILLFLLFFDWRHFNKNLLSPGSTFIYFSFLPALSNIYFSFFQDQFEIHVFGIIAAEYHDYFYVKVALLFTIFGNIITYYGIYIGVLSKGRITNFVFNRLLVLRGFDTFPNNIVKNNKFVLRAGIIIYFVGIVSYVIFVNLMGGFYVIWSELYLRSVHNIGLGYLQKFYLISIPLSSLLILSITLNKSQKLLSTVVILISVIILASTGARGPVIAFLLSVILLYHYRVKRIVKLFRIKYGLVALVLIAFIVTMVQFRKESFEYYLSNPDKLISNSIESFQSAFVGRVGRIERDIVILKYFEKHDFWFGKSYLGLFAAPIPRTMIQDKPPVDTGMYLRVMADGIRVDPPMPVYELDTSSWPEGNWAGYMNWGILGLLLLFGTSGFFLGRLFGYINRNKYPLVGTCLYATLAIGGAPPLSPYDIVSLLMLFIVFSFWVRFMRFHKNLIV